MKKLSEAQADSALQVRTSDIFLMLGVLLISLFFIILPLFSISNKNSQVEIYSDSKLIYKTSLENPRAYSVSGVDFVIYDNSVYVREANCPDKLCKNQGKINKAGQSIICLPNKVVAKIVGTSEVDTIAY
ncbi:NusG domain II-containing protein [Treponema sp. R6D11]